MAGFNDSSGFGDRRATPNPKLSSKLLGNLNNIWTKHLTANLAVANTDFANTISTVTNAPCTEFTHVRVLLKNGEASAPSVTGVILAVTNSITTSRVVPSTGNTLTGDGSTGWVHCTFSGSNTPTLATGTQTAPSTLMSDWIPINSIAPTDGGTWPYIMARIKFGGNYSAAYVGTQNSTNTQQTYIQSRIASGDFVTTPSGMTTGNSSTTSYNPIIGFEFLSNKEVIKILCVGSSTTQGYGSTPNDSLFRSWVPLAQETFLAAGIPINMINYGYAGQTSAIYIAYGKIAIANHKPTIAALQVYTPNDGTLTQTIANTQYAQCMDWANYCASQNCLPLLVFTTPNETLDGTSDPIRKALIARCKTTGFAVLDMTETVGDGASPEKYIPAYKFDTLHPNDAGYAVMTPAAVAVAQYIASQNISW